MRRGSVAFRHAELADAPAVAALHAASWRTAYRGIFTDIYLDGPVEAERLAHWRCPMSTPEPRRVVVLAEHDGRLAGFACGFADHDARWGSLIDNLHAAPDSKGQGIGRALMREIGRHLAATAPARPVHLTCLDGNTRALRFYRSIGGTAADREVKREPDGTLCSATRYAWGSPSALLAGCG